MPDPQGIPRAPRRPALLAGVNLAANVVAVCSALLAAPAARAYVWSGQSWADPTMYLGRIDEATKLRLRTVMAAGQAAGRVEGRMGQIGDSITYSSAFFRNAVLNGPTANQTGHDYAPVRSWLAYSGAQPADANSFYRDHGKGPEWGNASGWTLADAVAAGQPAAGVLVGDGGTAGEFSWALVMFGTNDIDGAGWSAPVWKEAMRAFLRDIADLGVVPVVSTIPPEAAHEADGRVEVANSTLRALAEEERIAWVDYGALILHYQPVHWHGTLIDTDGTHPTAGTGGTGFSQVALTSTDGYALRTKLAFDIAEKLRSIVWEDGPADAGTSVPAPDRAAGTPLSAFPNPAFGIVRLVGAPSGAALDILDVAGRRVAGLVAGADGEAPWNLRGADGRPVPAGVYFVRAGRRDAGGETARLVVRR